MKGIVISILILVLAFFQMADSSIVKDAQNAQPGLKTKAKVSSKHNIVANTVANTEANTDDIDEAIDEAVTQANTEGKTDAENTESGLKIIAKDSLEAKVEANTKVKAEAETEENSKITSKDLSMVGGFHSHDIDGRIPSINNLLSKMEAAQATSKVEISIFYPNYKKWMQDNPNPEFMYIASQVVAGLNYAVIQKSDNDETNKYFCMIIFKPLPYTKKPSLLNFAKEFTDPNDACKACHATEKCSAEYFEILLAERLPNILNYVYEHIWMFFFLS